MLNKYYYNLNCTFIKKYIKLLNNKSIHGVGTAVILGTKLNL